MSIRVSVSRLLNALRIRRGGGEHVLQRARHQSKGVQHGPRQGRVRDQAAVMELRSRRPRSSPT